jgi:hypothetical protein
MTKKQISGKWVIIDSDNHISYYPNFLTALKHSGSRVSIMTEEFYKTRYEDITRKR